MSRIRHIVIVTLNQEKLGHFYKTVFGMKEVKGIGLALTENVTAAGFPAEIRPSLSTVTWTPRSNSQQEFRFYQEKDPYDRWVDLAVEEGFIIV